MNALVRILARSGLLAKDLDYHLIRASMVLIFLAFGYQKWFEYETKVLVPYISNGPLLFWMYPVFGIRGASWFLGVAEWLFGTLLFLGFWNKRLGILGAVGSTLTFISTVTIIPFMPNGWDPAAGFPAMAGNVPFLIKDVVLLAASIYLLKQDAVRLLEAGHPARVALSQGQRVAISHQGVRSQMNSTTPGAVQRQQPNTPRAYKRLPALSNSTWYKGVLVSQMAGPADNKGAFDLVIAKMRKGTEPPPHVHTREDEFFYILAGEMRVFVDGDVFTVTAGECMFLPRQKAHAFLITSEEIHNIALLTPGGFLDAVNKMNAPAERMAIPIDADVATYTDANLTDTITVFNDYGVRFLTPHEIRTEMPQYPSSLHLSPTSGRGI